MLTIWSTMEFSSQEVTHLLNLWSTGDAEALEKLIPLIYGELRRIAGRHLYGERQNHTLQITGLVNEAYLRLAQQEVQWQSRAHFYAIAAQAMRRILIDYARNQHAQKRGGVQERVSLDESMLFSEQDRVSLLALDQAVAKLSKMDPRQGKIVEMRFFGELTIDEIAELLDLSKATVKREWTIAKAWLHREMTR
jgi:RNA polymerase sigma factor (TIGR02999 family)